MSDDSSKKRKRDSYTVGSCVPVSDYVKLGRLGKGTYGVVYQATERRRIENDQRRVVALKRCIPHHQATDGFPVTSLREIASLRICAGHPNIVHLEKIAVSQNGVFLVFEYCDHDLANLLDDYYQSKRMSPFSLPAVKSLMKDLLSALDYCHQHYIIHRDVKLSNLLYHEGVLKVADFGLSRSYSCSTSNNLTLIVASLWYRPPELLLGATTYTQSIDLWACGCVLTELLHGCPLLNGTNEQEQMELIIEHIGVWPSSNGSNKDLAYPGLSMMKLPNKSPRKLLDLFQESLSLEGLRLLTSLLDYHPHQRWTAAQALASPFFHEVDPPKPLRHEAMPKFPTLKTRSTKA